MAPTDRNQSQPKTAQLPNTAAKTRPKQTFYSIIPPIHSTRFIGGTRSVQIYEICMFESGGTGDKTTRLRMSLKTFLFKDRFELFLLYMRKHVNHGIPDLNI